VLAVMRNLARAVPYYVTAAVGAALLVLVVQSRLEMNRGAPRDQQMAQAPDRPALLHAGAVEEKLANEAWRDENRDVGKDGRMDRDDKGEERREKVKADRKPAEGKDVRPDAALGREGNGPFPIVPLQPGLPAPGKLGPPGGGMGMFGGAPGPGGFPGGPPAAAAPMPAGKPGQGGFGVPGAMPPMAPVAAGGAKPLGEADAALARRDLADQGKDAKKKEQAEVEFAKGGRAMPPAEARALRQRQVDELHRMAMQNGGRGPQPPPPPLVVREYAHQRPPGSTPEMRSDFTETLYWHPVLVLPESGKANVSFDLCDSVTTFQVTAFAHTLDGRLGSATQTLDSRLPFTVQPKTPIEVTASDRIEVPLAISNNTRDDRSIALKLTQHQGLDLLGGDQEQELLVQAGKPRRTTYRFSPSIVEGEAKLTFEGKAAPFPADAIRMGFRVVPQGFPVVGSHSDLLEGSASHTIELPATWVKGTLKCQASVYPSTLADLQKGLEGLLREPNGCFEQTSTTNYPNLLILDYLKESEQAKPEVEKRARELLSRGYQKLTSFECTNTARSNAKEGYEWFGGTAPAHEALTAYGLLQFRDMSRVQEVDPAMLKRTQDYLLQQKDGNGGFKRNQRALDTFGRAPEHITNAYIVWALTESGKDDVEKELTALNKQAKDSKDPYFLSLVANSLINRSQIKEGVELLKKVSAAQKEDGHLDADKTSITGSGGRDLQIETTALAVLGWLKANHPGDFTLPVEKAVKWIGQQRGGYGGFGSTQSTILALKALIAHARANKKTPEAGELHLYVGEKRLATLPFKANVSEALTLNLDSAEEHLHAGKNPVRVEITGKNVFPYTLTWSYQTLQPASAEGCPVKLTTALDRTEVKEGETVQLNVKVENASGQGQGMAVAILGLPGGLTVPEDMKQLKEHAKAPTDGSRPLVSAFEIRGRELVLYWRDLAPGQKIEVPVELICRVPGEYSGPASRAYLYYNADRKHWVEPLKVTIAARSE
jgi:hypothetical protein